MNSAACRGPSPLRRTKWGGGGRRIVMVWILVGLMLLSMGLLILFGNTLKTPKVIQSMHIPREAATDPGMRIMSQALLAQKQTSDNQGAFPIQVPAGGSTDCAREIANHQNKTSNEIFPCDFFRDMSEPTIIPGGSVYAHMSHMNDRFVFGGTECANSACTYPVTDDYPPNRQIVQLPGDAIVVNMHEHYFHFFFDTLLRLYPLHLHGIFKRYPNATILTSTRQCPITDQNYEFLQALQLDDLFQISKENFVMAQHAPPKVYTVKPTHRLIVARNHHYHEGPTKPYNRWLIDSLRRSQLKMVPNPTRQLFITRKGLRRGIQREEALYQRLQSTFLPHLEVIWPEDYSVAEQATIFANAALIVSPHGAALTNALFSNWEKVVVVELTNNVHQGFFGNDLNIPRHYSVRAPIVPCPPPKDPKKHSEECNPREQAIDLDEVEAAKLIQNLWEHPEQYGKQKIFEISGYNETEKDHII